MDFLAACRRFTGAMLGEDIINLGCDTVRFRYGYSDFTLMVEHYFI